MIFKRFFKDILLAREEATKIYKKITTDMTDKVIYKRDIDSTFVDRINEMYGNAMFRILNCQVKAQRSFSKKKIKNLIDAMNMIYEKFMYTVNYMIQETITVY